MFCIFLTEINNPADTDSFGLLLFSNPKQIRIELCILKYWSIEVLNHWSIEVLKYWSIEVLNYWIIELLNHCTLWTIYVFAHYGRFLYLHIMDNICIRTLWTISVFAHYGWYMYSDIMDNICICTLWTIYVSAHYEQCM